MVLLFNIIPDQSSYFPGDVVTATVEVRLVAGQHHAAPLT